MCGTSFCRVYRSAIDFSVSNRMARMPTENWFKLLREHALGDNSLVRNFWCNNRGMESETRWSAVARHVCLIAAENTTPRMRNTMPHGHHESTSRRAYLDESVTFYEETSTIWVSHRRVERSSFASGEFLTRGDNWKRVMQLYNTYPLVENSRKLISRLEDRYWI